MPTLRWGAGHLKRTRGGSKSGGGGGGGEKGAARLLGARAQLNVSLGWVSASTSGPGAAGAASATGTPA